MELLPEKTGWSSFFDQTSINLTLQLFIIQNPFASDVSDLIYRCLFLQSQIVLCPTVLIFPVFD